MSQSLDLHPADPFVDVPRLTDIPPVRAGLIGTLRPLAALWVRRNWRVRSHGAELVPRTGPVIMAANHLGVLDGPLAVAMSPRLTFALAKKTLFTGAVGVGLQAAGQIPVDQFNVNPEALRRCLRVLADGHALTIFPEGSRHGGEVSAIKGGVAYLAMVTGAPIVPVALLGTREPGQHIKAMPRKGAEMHIVYGEPVAIPQVAWPRTRDEVRARTEEVRRVLAAHVEQAQVLTGMPLPGAPALQTDPV